MEFVLRQTGLLSMAAAVAVVCGLSSSAQAGLIFNSASYDGFVRVGADAGVEEHLTTDSFPPPVAPIPLPATGDPPAPLNPAFDLSMTVTETIMEVGGELFNTAILQISRMQATDIFANPLDNTIPLPVEFEAELYLDNLAPGDKLVIAGVGVDSFDAVPFDSPGSMMVSNNRGSVDDPLTIKLGMAASAVGTRNGFVKLHFHYDTMPVPEPTALALALVGLGLGAVGLVRRRRQS